jgi:hypothetical protein
LPFLPKAIDCTWSAAVRMHYFHSDLFLESVVNSPRQVNCSHPAATYFAKHLIGSDAAPLQRRERGLLLESRLVDQVALPDVSGEQPLHFLAQLQIAPARLFEPSYALVGILLRSCLKYDSNLT